MDRSWAAGLLVVCRQIQGAGMVIPGLRDTLTRWWVKGNTFLGRILTVLLVFSCAFISQLIEAGPAVRNR